MAQSKLGYIADCVKSETKTLNFGATGDAKLFDDERIVLMVSSGQSTDYVFGIPYRFNGKTYAKGFYLTTAAFATNTTVECEILYL